MSFDNERQRRESKKICFICKLSPQNILMLACDDSVCLQCAYANLKDSLMRQQSRDQIEFRCRKCNQVTYFDHDLIKQIETSIRPQKIKRQIPIATNQYLSMKVQRNDESFIEKMKKQYLGVDNKIPKQNISQKKGLLNQTFNLNRKKVDTSEKNNFLLVNQYFNENRASFQSKQRVQKQTIQKLQENYQRNTSVKQSQNTKCKTHSYYEMLYYCVECQQIVCSQCLLRGRHKDHKNESIEKILTHELPNFINKTSEKLLSEVNRVQSIKDSKYSQISKKILEIKTIKQNALQYFHQVKNNIEKEEREVLKRCEQLLENLTKQQKDIEAQQNDIQMKLAYHIKEIKYLKSSYKQFLDFSNQKGNKILEKSLISRFINCSQSINEIFFPQNENKDCIRENQYSRQKQINNESKILNKQIQQSIESIRESLVFDPHSLPFKSLVKQQKNEQIEPQQSRLSFMKPLMIKKKPIEKPSVHTYISYLSTDNSPNKSKSKNFKKQQRSVSISPYKGESSFTTNNQTKITIPKNKHKNTQIHDIGKQNIYIQPHQKQSKTTKLFSQASSQNASSKKYTNQSKNSSISKSKNNSITKKKYSKIPNNLIAKFQV